MFLFLALPARFVRPAKLLLLALFALFGASACVSGGGSKGDGPGRAYLAHTSLKEPVKNLPKSRFGNMHSYTVFGKRYTVLDSAEGFTETGVASWYGRQFHGRKTSSGEPYNMYAFTAAHKHLPLPTFVRVTNLDNGRDIVVKVNDRGPFADDRIIDMSYGAAIALDMHAKGTARVSVEALTTHHVAGSAPVVASAESYMFQLGAFSEQRNARTLVDRLSSSVSLPAFVEPDALESLYRVKLGPVAAGAQLETTRAQLANAGIEGYTMKSAIR